MISSLHFVNSIKSNSLNFINHYFILEVGFNIYNIYIYIPLNVILRNVKFAFTLYISAKVQFSVRHYFRRYVNCVRQAIAKKKKHYGNYADGNCKKNADDFIRRVIFFFFSVCEWYLLQLQKWLFKMTTETIQKKKKKNAIKSEIINKK